MLPICRFNSKIFGFFVHSLGGRQRRPHLEEPEPSMGYHFGRVRILTLSQGLRAKRDVFFPNILRDRGKNKL